MSRPRKSKVSEKESDLDRAFKAFQDMPKIDKRPEGSWTRQEFQDKHKLSRGQAQSMIKSLLENGAITVHDHIGSGGTKYYTTA
jgi:hypothetical protein